jgi:UDP-N-acetylmuramate dehydrogenase
MNIQKNYPLKDLNTFGIDVKAQLFANIKSEEQLYSLLTDKIFKDMPKFILGGGSNILFIQDFEGIVIKNSIPGIEIIKQDENYVWIKAGAGIIWHHMVLFCVERNLGGIENLSLIPGTVGAAPIQNIGAYGQEVKDVFENLEGLHIDSGDKKIFTSNQCKFAYRDSVFKRELKNKFVITSLVLRLSKKPVLNLNYGAVREELEKLNLENFTIKNVSDVICKIRQSKLPDPKQIANAGSFFKNPEIGEDTFLKLKKEFPAIIGYPLENKKVKLAAGWLIEQCGWKGKRVGNTGSHSKQALVLVNYGGAKGSDILALAEQIKESVKNKFGIKLEEEINII